MEHIPSYEMDIRNENPAKSTTSVFTKGGIALVAVSLLFTVAMGIAFGLRVGVISSVSVLVAVGVVTSNSWNRELKKDGYVSLSQLYTTYLAVVFLFIAMFPTLSGIFGLIGGLGFSVLVSLVYVITLNSVAFRGIEDHETAVSTYEGPSVVYLPDGPYFDHIEQVAQKNKAESEEE